MVAVGNSVQGGVLVTVSVMYQLRPCAQHRAQHLQSVVLRSSFSLSLIEGGYEKEVLIFQKIFTMLVNVDGGLKSPKINVKVDQSVCIKCEKIKIVLAVSKYLSPVLLKNRLPL